MFTRTNIAKGDDIVDKRKLIQDKNVVEEINRHKWLQSEMAGHDIGLDHAAAWLDAQPKKKRK